VTYPYPAVLAGAGHHDEAPVVPQYLMAVASSTNANALLATYGGVSMTQANRVFRVFVHGPLGSRCDAFLGDLQPLALIADPRYQFDYTLTGNADYADYDVPIVVPAGSYLVFLFTGGASPAGGAVVRLETQTVRAVVK
jgi:hypothetical protein